MPKEADSIQSRQTCPSVPCREAATLVGFMTGSGQLAYVRPPTPIDAGFAAAARAQGRPESRFRFAGPCVEAGCPQWTGSSCGLIDMLIDEEPPEPRRLPACAIRPTCRWFAQRGAEACWVCPKIVADVGGADTYQARLEREALIPGHRPTAE